MVTNDVSFRHPFSPLTRYRPKMLALFMLLAMTACGDKDEDEFAEPKQVLPVEDLYRQGVRQMQSKDVKDAIETFEEVEREYPFSEWAKRAKIMAAYGYYYRREYDDAIPALQQFVKLYPADRNTPYAYYLIALCYYEQIADVARDQHITEEAMQALNEVTSRFPETDYARDARLKFDLVRDHLAGKEMEIGRFYQKRDQYLAAINRYRYVIDYYETTSHVQEALHRLTECYLSLGLQDDAERTAAVLGYNYPESEWYSDSYRLMVEKSELKRPDQRENLLIRAGKELKDLI